MKNWKTTLIGLLAGVPMAIDALVQAYNAGYFTGKTGWQLFAAILFTLLGRVLKDSVLKAGIGGSNPPVNKDEK